MSNQLHLSERAAADYFYQSKIVHAHSHFKNLLGYRVICKKENKPILLISIIAIINRGYERFQKQVSIMLTIIIHFCCINWNSKKKILVVLIGIPVDSIKEVQIRYYS